MTAGDPYRVELILWVEVPEDVVVGAEVVDPKARASVTQILARSMLQPLVGPPRRPTRLRVADAKLAAELRAAVPDVDVVVASTPELDAVLAHMIATMPASDEGESYLEAGRVPADVVATLFRAAEMLHRLAPWRIASDDQVLRVDVPALGVHGACMSIIGGLGESLGFVLFPSLAGYEAFVDAVDGPRRERSNFGTTTLSLTFERGADVAPARRREVATFGWPVAGPQAFPRVEHRDPDGLPRPLTEHDVRVMTACAQALGTFSLRHPRAFVDDPLVPVCETYTDDDDLAVRVTFPYEAHDTFEIDELPRRAAPRVSRNAPCPCGSGKKYKKCCLRAGDEAAAPARPAPIHAMDERLVLDMMRYARRRFGDAVKRAAEDFRDPGTSMQLFCPWAVYGFHVEGRPIVAWYVAERGRYLPASAREWLAAQQRAWLSVWEVLAVESDTGITVRDLLSGTERNVHEVSGSRTLSRRDAVLARVVDHAGDAVFCGSHPRPLSPAAAATVVRRMRTTLRTKGPVPVERLREDTIGRRLIARWEEAVAALDRAQAVPPELHNTDGDPLLLTVDHFVFAPTDGADIEACLGAMDHVQCPEADEPEAYFIFLGAGNPMHKSWETTVIGRAVVSDGTLKVETNSVRRADTLRQRVANACGDRLRHRAREHVDPTSARVQAAHREVPTLPLESPEATELVRAYKERHYADWVDHPLPALRGRTPRQAVRTKAGRERVDVLLKEMENHESRLAEGARFDFGRLRAELEAQFRCAGSDGFVRWVENTLGLERTANVLWDPTDAFDFRIFDTPAALEAAIREKADAGARARMTAGFCWKWSKPLDSGGLVRDVTIGDWKRPWNAKPEARRLAPGIPRASLWASDPGGLDQVGCVYTAQGFEFDYVGVIWGLDLTYDLDRQTWVGTPAHSYDTVVKRAGPRFVELVKNTYRVLLTRGLKGCYVHFTDRDTERFVRSRIEEG